MKAFLSALLILVTGTAWAQESPAERIAPYLTDTAVAVGHINLEAVDIEASADQLVSLLKVASRSLDPAEQSAIADLQKLDKAGIQDIFVIIDVAASHEDWCYFVFPLSEGKTSDVPGTVVGDVSIAGPERIIKHFQGEPPVTKRSGLVAAFEAVAKSPFQLVFVPTADQRKVFREMLPDLSKGYGNVRGSELAAGLKWAAAGVTLGPDFKAKVVIQSNSKEAAGRLAEAITHGLRQAALRDDVLEKLPLAPLLVGVLVPKQEGSRLIFSLGEDTGKTSKWLASLFGIARTGARRDATRDRMKQLGLAMHNFHGTYKSFPPSASYSKDGQPLLSWRVFVLPYVEEGALYKQFHLDEPWNSEHNKKLIDKMPEAFKSPLTPTKPGMTVFQVPSGKGLIFDGKTGTPISKIIDGTSNTIIVVETTAEKAVPWTKPDDLKVNLEKPLAGLAGDREGFWALFADGSVQFIASKIDPETLKALFTRAGGEVVGEY